MEVLLAVLVLVVVALVGARFSFPTGRVPAGPRLLLRTGMHWLVLGYVLGPRALGLLGSGAVASLTPMVTIGLGWVGLLFGLQLARENLKQFPLGFHVFALGQAVLTFVVFMALGVTAMELAGGRSPTSTLLLAGAAATAAVTTPAGIALVSSNFLVRGNVRRLLFFVASVDAVVGVLALQITYSVFHPAAVVGGMPALSAAFWIALATGLGIVSGIVFLWLLRPRPGADELVLFLLGVSALGSGAALQLQVSPLFVCATMGALVANFAEDWGRIFQALEKWEKPIYVVLLLLAGALVDVPTWWVVPLAVGYFALRLAGKVVSGAAMASIIPFGFPAPRRLGLGLVPQGGIVLAMAISLVLTYAGVEAEGGVSGADVLFATIVLGVAMSELVGPFFTTQVLRRAGEISPQVEEALVEGDEEKAEAAALRHNAPAQSAGGEPPDPDGGS